MISKIKQIFTALIVFTIVFLHSNYFVFYQILNDNFNCSPLNKNSIQYYVEIDKEIYPKIVPSFFNSSINFECLNRASKKAKVILLWNDYGPWKDYQYGIGKYKPFFERKCPVRNCEITNNRSRLSESDLVLVHMRSQYPYLPLTRPEKTRMVFYIAESPIHSYQFHPNLNGLFNLTATYNLNSDFSPHYYSNIEFKWEFNSKFDEKQDFSKKKTKLAVFLATNCVAFSKRAEYVREMQKYSNSIHVYGGCGKSCNIEGEDRFSSNLCREKLSKEYRFFLAFENSMCKDYVTEKLFDTVLFDTVPVVYGYGPYDKFIPRSAYINALDFKTPKDLVNYLVYLQNNSTAYNSYFKWKKYIKKTNIKHHTLCDMCIKLNMENFFGIKKSQVNDLESFWGVRKNCWASPSIGRDGSFLFYPINYTYKCSICN